MKGNYAEAAGPMARCHMVLCFMVLNLLAIICPHFLKRKALEKVASKGMAIHKIELTLET